MMDCEMACGAWSARMIFIMRSVVILAILFVVSGSALAELGGNEESITMDQTQMKASRRNYQYIGIHNA